MGSTVQVNPGGVGVGDAPEATGGSTRGVSGSHLDLS
jgi:hypothetical protein